MNTMTESRNLAVQGRQKMTPSEAFVETLVAQGVTDVFGIVGSAYMDALDLFPQAGHSLHLGRARAGRRPHGRRLRARVGPPRRLHRAERARHHELRHVDRRCVLGAFAGRRRHAGNGLDDPRPRRVPGNRAAADLLEDHQVPGARQQPRADGRAHRAARSIARCSRWDRRSSTSRAISSTATSNAKYRGRSRSSAARAARRASTRPPRCSRRRNSR